MLNVRHLGRIGRGLGTREKMPGLVSALVIYYFVTNYPNIERLKTANIYYLIVSVGNESRHGLAECPGSRSLTRAQSVGQGVG